MSEIHIRSDGTLYVIGDNGNCLFSGTPKEIQKLEQGCAARELILTLKHLITKLEEE